MEQHGLGDGAGMIFGMNMAQSLDEKAMKPSLSLDEQIEALTKLKSLLDAGILSQEEFDRKKKEIMDLYDEARKFIVSVYSRDILGETTIDYRS